MSTAIQINHCSRYLCAKAQIPMMLKAVVKLSAIGTVLLVKLLSIK